MARMARTQPSGVDFMLARVEFQGKLSPIRSRLFWGGKQAATVRGGTAEASRGALRSANFLLLSRKCQLDSGAPQKDAA